MSVTAEIERLILLEAQLLDDWKLDEWLTLFAPDGIYWIPIDETADPRLAPSIMYDDALMRAMRVEQLLHHDRPSQTPPSATARFVSNIVVTPDDAEAARARCNLMAVELRVGDWRQYGLGHKREFVGRCDYTFRRSDGAWKIVEKRVLLLDRAQPIESLTFFL